MENECQTLKNALKDKADVLINYVLSKTKRERYEIRNTYKSVFGKELLEEIDHALNGNFRKAVIDLFRPPQERDAFYLYKSMKGVGTDEETLIEIICSRPNVDLIKIKEEYKRLYNEELEKKVTSDTSGDLRKILISVLQ